VSAPAWRRDGPREPQPTDRQLEAIRRFVEKPEGSLTIGRLSEAVQRMLGAETSDVLLSAETMVKQRLRHPDVGVDDYLLVPLALAEPTAGAYPAPVGQDDRRPTRMLPEQPVHHVRRAHGAVPTQRRRAVAG
jgi:hypothetical protein